MHGWTRAHTRTQMVEIIKLVTIQRDMWQDTRFDAFKTSAGAQLWLQRSESQRRTLHNRPRSLVETSRVVSFKCTLSSIAEDDRACYDNVTGKSSRMIINQTDLQATFLVEGFRTTKRLPTIAPVCLSPPSLFVSLQGLLVSPARQDFRPACVHACPYSDRIDLFDHFSFHMQHRFNILHICI